MKVFVTGSTGFIGRQVTRFLVKRGFEVVGCTDVSIAASKRPDLLNPSEVEAFFALEKPEGLVHLAWDTTPGVYWESGANLRWAGASLSLLESFSRHGGKRAVVAGTSAEYQWGGYHPLCEESSPLAPDSLYGFSKDSLRRILEFWAPAAGVSLAWGRIFSPFGPHEKEARLIPKLITKLQSGATLPFDSGSLVRDFLHVEDLGAAFAALFDSQVEGAVNLASGEALTIRHVLATLGETLGRSEQIQFDTLPDPEDQAPFVVASIKRLRDEVGWNPTGDTRQRLEETCQWWGSRNSKELQSRINVK
jgi:nucleoside-diphosphate-sugar epimerase